MMVAGSLMGVGRAEMGRVTGLRRLAWFGRPTGRLWLIAAVLPGALTAHSRREWQFTS